MDIFQDSEPVLFWIIAGLTAGSAIMTLLAQNIVRSATWLLFALGGTAGIFFLLGADFVGATQLLVYVGGTLILVVFGVMLTAQGPFITMKSSAAEWAISLMVGVALYATLAVAAYNTARPMLPVETLKAELKELDHKLEGPLTVNERKNFLEERKIVEEELKTAEKRPVAIYGPKETLDTDPAKARYLDTIGRGLLGQGVGPAHKENGKVVRTSYLLPFEIVSVHLLVVLIGAAYLARAKRRRGATTS